MDVDQIAATSTTFSSKPSVKTTLVVAVPSTDPSVTVTVDDAEVISQAIAHDTSVSGPRMTSPV